MRNVPPAIAEFLAGRRIAVAGVSRHGDTAANAVFQKLRDGGYEVYAVNPNATEVEGVRCWPDLASLPADVDGVVIGTHPDVALGMVRQAIARGVRRVWFHRSFGNGSVSQPAVDAARAAGLTCIVGGCPRMYCEPVDLGHRCMCWWLDWRGRISA